MLLWLIPEETGVVLVLSFNLNRGMRVLSVLDRFISVTASLVSDDANEVCKYVTKSYWIQTAVFNS